MQNHTTNLAGAVEALDVCLEKNQGHDLLGVVAGSQKWDVGMGRSGWLGLSYRIRVLATN